MRNSVKANEAEGITVVSVFLPRPATCERDRIHQPPCTLAVWLRHLKRSEGLAISGKTTSFFPTDCRGQRMAYPHARSALSFGREVRVPAAENQNAGKRKPIMRPLAFTDFSRSRIEEHYVTSHPEKWREYKRKLESKGRSDATNSEFFNTNKLTSHFRRVQNDGVLKNVSRSVGDLIRSLYERDELYAANDPDVRSVTILDAASSDSEEDTCNNNQRGYVADLGS
jgi:plasmid stabilization system protein ParE